MPTSSARWRPGSTPCPDPSTAVPTRPCWRCSNEIVLEAATWPPFVNRAKDKKDPFRLMGFGHRVYKNFDPRARIIKQAADEVLDKLGVDDPLLEVAKRTRGRWPWKTTTSSSEALSERRFLLGDHLSGHGVSHGYVHGAVRHGSAAGWMAQWREMAADPEAEIFRPRQVYTGPAVRDVPPSTSGAERPHGVTAAGMAST